MTYEYLIEDCERKCPDIGPTNVMIAQVTHVRLRPARLLIWLVDLNLDDMDGIIIGTPQGDTVQAIHYLQIPWFRFQTLIEPFCNLRIFLT